MEESLIPGEEKKKKDNKQKKTKKKSFFCCCFGSSADNETDEDPNEYDNNENNGYSNNQDCNMNTAIPNSQASNQGSEIFASQGNSQRNRAKKSPQRDRKREKDSPSENSNIIREQGDENNSSSSSQQKANQQNQMQSHPTNINQKNQMQNSVPNPVNNSSKKSQEYKDQNEGDTTNYYDQHNLSNQTENTSYLKSMKSSPKRHKYNIKAFLQNQNQLQTELFHLYCKKRENYLLIKLMERNFQSNSILGSQINIANQAKQSISQKGVVSSTLQTDPNSYFYNKNFKSDFDSQFNAIPEPICQYLAQRLKNQFVIDAFCGVGYNTVQFAKEAQQVVAIDMNQVKVSHARYNIEQFKLLHKVEVIQSDFLHMKKLKGDVVVLHPDYRRQDQSITSSVSDDAIDLFNDVSPNLVESIQQSLSIADSVVLILQKNCDIQQLPQILDQINLGVSQLVEICEKSINEQNNRKTLFQEFFDSINNEKRGKIRSSGSLQFEIEGFSSTDKALQQLLQEIQSMLNTNAKANQKSHSPASNADNEGYQSSFSYSNNKFDFDSANKQFGQQKKNKQFNQSMQEPSNDTSNNFQVQKSGIAVNKLKGLSKNQQGGNKRVEISNGPNKTFKGSDTSSSNNPHTNSNQQHYSEDTNSFAQGNDFDLPTSLDNEDDYGDSVPKIIYSCSYGTNTLVDSEISDSNSLRPQLSNGIYFNGSTEIYEDQEFRNSIMNQTGGGTYYNRPITKPTSSVAGIGLNREQFQTGSLPNNGSGKGQILMLLGKNQKNNGSKNNLSGNEDHQHQRSGSKMYYQQLEFEDDGEDFCWEQEEEDTDKTKEKQQKSNQTKIKNSNNTYQHNPDLDDSYKKTDVFTVPNSLS